MYDDCPIFHLWCWYQPMYDDCYRLFRWQLKNDDYRLSLYRPNTQNLHEYLHKNIYIHEKKCGNNYLHMAVCVLSVLKAPKLTEPSTVVFRKSEASVKFAIHFPSSILSLWLTTWCLRSTFSSSMCYNNDTNKKRLMKSPIEMDCHGIF